MIPLLHQHHCAHERPRARDVLGQHGFREQQRTAQDDVALCLSFQHADFDQPRRDELQPHFVAEKFRRSKRIDVIARHAVAPACRLPRNIQFGTGHNACQPRNVTHGNSGDYLRLWYRVQVARRNFGGFRETAVDSVPPTGTVVYDSFAANATCLPMRQGVA